MTTATLTLVCLIFGFSIVQSIFGVGLLVFGTPSLLLLGYSFAETLAILLPCSITVNFFQVSTSWKQIDLKEDFAFFCLPAVVACLSLVLIFHVKMNIRLEVGILMLLTALVRSVAPLRKRLEKFSLRFSRPSLLIIGILHGFTNMGGGLLSIFVSAVSRQKQSIRANIAYGYFLMALCQVGVLAVSGGSVFKPENFLFPLIAAGTYLVVGNRAFLRSSERSYQGMLTGFISIFGLILVFG